MKKSIFVLFVLVSTVYFFGCSEEDIINNPVTSTRGIYVLFEGLFNQPATYDYTYINIDSNVIYSNVYQNSNSGAHLNAVPDGMIAHSTGLYIVAQGNFGQAGTIYKINLANNQLIVSRNFGTNPYNLGIGNNKIYVTNTASDYISVMDLNFNTINDSISVGPNPSDLVVTGTYVFVAKQSYTTENSLAVITQSSSQVNKFFFPAPPVGIDLVENWVCVSTYSHKKIYRFYGDNGQIIDSIPVNVTEPAIGSVCHGDANSLFILGIPDTTFAGNIGKRVYKLNLTTLTLDPNFNVQFSGSDDAYGISYNYPERKLYVANSKSGLANGELRVYDDNGNLVRTYADIGGKFPKRIVFTY